MVNPKDMTSEKNKHKEVIGVESILLNSIVCRNLLIPVSKAKFVSKEKYVFSTRPKISNYISWVNEFNPLKTLI